MPDKKKWQCACCARRRRPDKVLCVWCAESQKRYERRRKRWRHFTPEQRKRKLEAQRRHYRKHIRRLRKENLARVLKWQKEHPERRRAKDRRYYLKHKKQVSLRMKRYYQEVLRPRRGLV